DYKVTGVQTCALPIFLAGRVQHPVQDSPERLEAGELLYLVGFEQTVRRQGAILKRPEDLDPLNRVDPKLRLDVHAQVEHLRWIRSEERRVGKECRFRG